MYLKTLHLRQFRNYQDCRVHFNAPKTILVGDNAQGKSNLLEAVELLATLKSHRSVRDRELVWEEATVGEIRANLERAYGSVELSVTLRSQGRRTVALNQESLRRQLDFLGILNAVQFSSLDLELVRGAPERRRSWLDSILTQLEPIYAYILQQYNQILRQRNALLKKIRKQEIEGTNELPCQEQIDQLALWDAQLATAGSRVTRRRARMLKRLAPIAKEWHASISGATEVLEINYAPNVSLEQDDPEGVQKAFLYKIQQRRIPETASRYNSCWPSSR